MGNSTIKDRSYYYGWGNGRTHGAPFRGYGYVPLRNGGNVVRRMGTQQQLRVGWGDYKERKRFISNSNQFSIM